MTIKETRKKIIDSINESGLALDVIDLILHDLYITIHGQLEKLEGGENNGTN